MSRSSVTIGKKHDAWVKLTALIDDLKARDVHVRVGVLEGTPAADEHRGNEGIGNQAIGMGRIGVAHGSAKQGITNAQLAAVQEFGTKDGRIPERSFIRSTFADNRPTYLGMLKRLLTRVVEGKIAVEDVFEMMGLKISTDIKNRVTQGEQIPPPNTPSVLERKIHKGAWNKSGVLNTKWAPRTLVDTGRMIGAMTYAVYRGLVKTK